ncbi:sugar ABC transporter substrate-binding protein [Escherichia coli]|nr:sugar ABC transporter substrate-binding protein [Escherichia coli]
MKRTILGAAIAALMAGGAHAETIGVTMQSFDDNFQTLLRNGVSKRAGELENVSVQVEDSQRDVSRQLSQVNNFIASGVGAIIVTLADTAAAPAISQAAEKAGIPLVYLNLEPENVKSLPDDQAYVGSLESDAGKLGATEACRLLKGKTPEANAYIMMGDLAHTAAVQRTQAVKDVLATPECSFIKIRDEQQAGWLRTNALDLMTNWLTAGDSFDVVFANNDEMAIGAAQAMKAAAVDMDKVLVIGVDATQDGLAAMKAGDLDVTVFQNAAAQAAGAVDAAMALAKKEPIGQTVYVPFELVTPDNMDKYALQN